MRESIVIFSISCLVVACGGSPEAVAPSSKQAPVAASADTTALTFLLVPGGGTRTAAASNEALRSALVSAGFKIVIDKRAPHDVELVTRIAATEERSMFAVQVNGRSDTNERVHLTASVISQGQVLDELAADFQSKNNQVNPSDVLPAVTALSSSPRIAQFGKQLREQTEARARARQDKDVQDKARAEEDLKQKQRLEEENEWNRARVTACRQPTSLTGCDVVRTYVAKYPAGIHAEEAQAALKASEPLMEKLQKDENAWKTAGVESCRAERTREACTGVELYVTKFAGGAHVDEAQGLLRRIP